MKSFSNDTNRVQWPNAAGDTITKAARNVLPLNDATVPAPIGNGVLLVVECTNNNTSPIYVRFYDCVASDFSAATSLPLCEFLVPGATSTPGQIIVRAGNTDRGWYYKSALCVRVCTGFAFNDDTDASTAPHLFVETSRPSTTNQLALSSSPTFP